MLTTVTLWTLMIWAESTTGRALTVTTVPGFANEKSCQSAQQKVVMKNAALSSGQTGIGKSNGQTGIDIKLIICVPVEYEKEVQ